MSQFDWEFFCKTLSVSTNLSVRVFKGGELLCYHSILDTTPDPFILHKDEILGKPEAIGTFITPLYQLYGYFDTLEKERIVIGATGFIVKDDDKLQKLAEQLGVKKELQENYINKLNAAPYVSIEKLSYILATLAYLLTNVEFPIDYISDQKSLNIKQILNETVDYLSTKTLDNAKVKEVVNGYELENNLMSLIQNGQADTIKTLLYSHSNSKSGQMSKTALRQLKNTFICAAAIASRKAIDGGLDAFTAFSLSDTYIQNIEVINDYNTISALMNEMMVDYAERVKNVNFPIGNASKFIVKCVQYVARNLTNVINISDMAEELKLSRAYLCSQFKAQTSIALSQYILQEKILEAKRLLSQTDKTLSEISVQLAFSSQSHFQNVFKKYVGKTPKAYRDDKN